MLRNETAKYQSRDSQKERRKKTGPAFQRSSAHTPKRELVLPNRHSPWRPSRVVHTRALLGSIPRVLECTRTERGNPEPLSSPWIVSGKKATVKRGNEYTQRWPVRGGSTRCGTYVTKRSLPGGNHNFDAIQTTACTKSILTSAAPLSTPLFLHLSFHYRLYTRPSTYQEGAKVPRIYTSIIFLLTRSSIILIVEAFFWAPN